MKPTEPKGFLAPDELAELRQLHDNCEVAEKALQSAQGFLNDEVALRKAFLVRLKRRYGLDDTDTVDLDTGACKATPGPAVAGAKVDERRRTSSGRAGTGGGGLRPDRRSRILARDNGHAANAGDKSDGDAASQVESEHDGRPNDLSGGG